MRRFAKFAVLALAAGLFVNFGVLDPRGRWRSAALLEKASGGLPGVSWAETATAIVPQSLRKRAGTALAEVARTNGEEPCPVLWKTLAGDFWGREADRWLVDFLVREQWVERIYEHARSRVRPGDVVLDVGAHLGTFTRFALSRGASKVVAFEPEPTNRECFKQTFSEELRAGSVVLIEAAAWESAGTLQFDLPDGAPNTGMGRVTQEGRLVVDAVTIDAVREEQGLDRVDFIKMDIEGAERQALAGAKATLARFGPRMALCVYHRPDDREALPAIALEARPSYKSEIVYRQAYFY